MEAVRFFQKFDRLNRNSADAAMRAANCSGHAADGIGVPAHIGGDFSGFLRVLCPESQRERSGHGLARHRAGADHVVDKA